MYVVPQVVVPQRRARLGRVFDPLDLAERAELAQRRPSEGRLPEEVFAAQALGKHVHHAHGDEAPVHPVLVVKRPETARRSADGSRRGVILAARLFLLFCFRRVPRPLDPAALLFVVLRLAHGRLAQPQRRVHKESPVGAFAQRALVVAVHGGLVPAPQPVLLLVKRRRRLANLENALRRLRLRCRVGIARLFFFSRLRSVSRRIRSGFNRRGGLVGVGAAGIVFVSVVDGDAFPVVVQLAVEVLAPSLLHLPLRLGGRERARVEPNGVRGTARVVEVRAVHPAAAPAPPSIEQGLVIFHRTHVRVHAVRLGGAALTVAVTARAGVRAVVLHDTRRGRNRLRTARAGGGGGHGAGCRFRSNGANSDLRCRRRNSAP